MGQKIHPTGFRLAVSRNWASRWYASNRDFAGMLAEDIKVREYLKAKLKNAAVSRVLIERPAKNARITIFSARPGVVIGKKGEDIENLKKELATRLGVPVAVNIEEVRKPEIDAKLIADSITQQLEKRIMFRRAMKRAMQSAMRLGAQGIKIMSSGRLNGIEIARTEWYREGRVPLHTLRADIDYGFSEAKTTYGIIGVKVWVYKGDTLGRNDLPAVETPRPDDERRPRGPRRDGRRDGGRDGAGRGARRPAGGNAAPADGSDKAAAAALASFGDGQLQMMQDAQAGFMQASPTAPPPTRDGQMSFMNLPQTLPCGSLSLDSMYPSTSPGFSHQQFQMAFEYALANHIMQYHDPSRGMAHAGNCLANDPGQFISKCTLPKFSANDNVTDPYLSQLQGGHECGFQVQDPNAFAHHIFEEHRPALMLHAQHFRQPGVPQSNIHVHHGVSHHHGSHPGSHMGSQMIQGKNFSPSPSPLAALSMGPSLSTTPSSSLATPSPLESETGFTEPSSSARSKSPHAESKPHILTEEDQFRCRWVMGDGSGICGHRFDNDEELQKHCKLDHLKPLKKVRGGFRCGWEGCTRDTCFTQRSKVERHMQVHTGCEFYGSTCWELSRLTVYRQTGSVHHMRCSIVCKASP